LKGWLILMVLLACSLARAETPATAALVTDRPTDSVAPVVVPAGSLQVEAGYRFSRFDTAAGDIDTHLFPDLLLRYGVHPRFEARLFASGWNITDTPDDTDTAFSDVSLGAKIYLADAQGYRPQMAVLLDVSFPVGAEQVTSDYVIPKVLFAGAHSLPRNWGLTYNVGPSYVTYQQQGQHEADWDLNYAVALGRAVDKRLSLFAEIYGAYISGRDLPDRHNLQAGLTWLLTPKVQLDARLGTGLSSTDEDLFAGAGIAFRLPR